MCVLWPIGNGVIPARWSGAAGCERGFQVVTQPEPRAWQGKQDGGWRGAGRGACWRSMLPFPRPSRPSVTAAVPPPPANGQG